jgi:DNA repair protein RecN (Recombination protein N)
MLSQIKVKHFAIIDELEMNFENGLNVISGETGSGKSVLLKALALMMGEKSHADSIKTGETQASVEAEFNIKSRNDIKKSLIQSGFTDTTELKDVEPTMIIRRVFTTDGKNRVYINGHMSTLQQLKEIVSPLIEVTGHPSPLIEITGQHENRNLQSKIYHLEMLDHYLGLSAIRQDVGIKFHELSHLTERLAQLRADIKTRTQRLDFLTFQRDEIKTLNLIPNEDEILINDIRRARESTKYYEFIENAEASLYSDEDSCLVRLHRVVQKGQELAVNDLKLAEMLKPMIDARAVIEASTFELRDYARNLHVDPDELDAKETRLSQIRKLQKKFGPSVDNILSQLVVIEAEIATLDNFEIEIDSIEKKTTQLNKTLRELAEKLHASRMKGVNTLIQSVNSELEELNMKGVQFSVAISLLENIGPSGITDLEFTIQNSKKDVPRALGKFASGGELSRILLSLKRVVGHNELPRTYIFDEVDAGVSGVTAEKVGRKLKAISKGQQVISVTHLPQVAAFADCHFSIFKTNKKSGPSMQVQVLNKEERIQEVARMLSGEKITAASIANAKDLIKCIKVPGPKMHINE